eukprot:368214_1
MSTCPLQERQEFPKPEVLLAKTEVWWSNVRKKILDRCEIILTERRRLLETALTILYNKRSELPQMFLRHKDRISDQQPDDQLLVSSFFPAKSMGGTMKGTQGKPKSALKGESTGGGAPPRLASIAPDAAPTDIAVAPAPGGPPSVHSVGGPTSV